jgi:hypothetical protein
MSVNCPAVQDRGHARQIEPDRLSNGSHTEIVRLWDLILGKGNSSELKGVLGAA